MNLLIDSGNSFIKWAQAKDGSITRKGLCPTAVVSTLVEKWTGYNVPVQVIVSNVAGKVVAAEISRVVTTLWQLDAEFIVSSQSCCGLTNRYHKPEQLGADRWMAMVAAYQMMQNSVIVVDCGTAVTIDLVNEKGQFVGGVIMPGLSTAFQSLRTETDAVDEISSINSDASSVAQSTEEGVAAGVLLGLAGGVERVVREETHAAPDNPC
jgi:type III pantothenate kinase